MPDPDDARTALDAVVALRAELRGMKRALVCFSGGVDSGYLLAEAVRAMGEGVVAFTAVSPSLDPEEAAYARSLAAKLGATHLLVETRELEDARYRANGADRCLRCKTEVYGAARREARARGIAHVVDGMQRDDRGDHRPGRAAARALGVRSPLDAHGFDKALVRASAKSLGLAVWDKPELACLASRFPTGVEVTEAGLVRVGRAERAVRELGFRVVRVRSEEDGARIEVGADEVAQLAAMSDAVEGALRALGFARVAINPRGYRRGGANAPERTVR